MMAVPNFLFALVLMFIFCKVFNTVLGGLYSPQFLDAP